MTTSDEEFMGRGFVGRFFLTFGDDGKISHQGVVRDKVDDGFVLVQYFDWFTGSDSTMQVVRIGDMASVPDLGRLPGAWIFFQDEAHMKNWLEGFGKKYLHGRG